MKLISNSKTEIFCDGANYKDMILLNKRRYIKGFTTNPSLMRSAGVNNYTNFAKRILKIIKKKSVSFEIFSDDLEEMYLQACKISKWGKNVFVKVPITNTKGTSCAPVISALLKNKIKVNVTAVFTYQQINELHSIIKKNDICIISIFAGRIADTGVSPVKIIKKAVKLFSKKTKVKILWASTREPYNLIEAQNINCHIITIPISMLTKLNSIGKDLKEFSRETVKMFYDDAKKSLYKI